MKSRWSLISSLIFGGCLISAPCQAQEAAKTQDQMQNQATMKQIPGEPEYFLRKHLVASPMPEYPQAAQQEGIQGKVIVFVWFDEKDGNLVEAKPLASPDESLSKAVVSALKEWRIKPYMPYNP